MTTTERVLLAIAIVLADVVLFALPITGFFAAFVLLVRPPWILVWLQQLYSDQS